MREYAKISPKCWINEMGRKLKTLGLEAQLISFYLQTNPHANMIGVYYLPMHLIAHETGLGHEVVLNTMCALSEVGFCSYDSQAEYVWVHEMASDQITGQLKPNDNRIKAVNTAFESLPSLSFGDALYERYEQAFFLSSNGKPLGLTEAPSEPLRSQEKEQDQENEQKIRTLSGKPDIAAQEILSCKDEAIDVLAFLNHKTGKAYRPVDANLKLIIARLKSGATAMDCRQIIAKKYREWKDDPKMSTYLRPATLFSAINFEQYIGELVLPKKEVNHDDI